MPPCRRRQTRAPWTPKGGGVIVSVHSTALPPWSRVPQGEGVRDWPTVPRLLVKALAYVSGSRPKGLTVAQASADWPAGHQVGALVSRLWKIESGWVEALVTSPVVGSSVA